MLSVYGHYKILMSKITDRVKPARHGRLVYAGSCGDLVVYTKTVTSSRLDTELRHASQRQPSLYTVYINKRDSRLSPDVSKVKQSTVIFHTSEVKRQAAVAAYV